MGFDFSESLYSINISLTQIKRHLLLGRIVMTNLERKERKKESEVTQSYPTLCDPMDCSLPSSSVHWIFQVIVLEWFAISFSIFIVYFISNLMPLLS